MGISRSTTAGVNVPGYSKAGIRKSKTSRWRAAALITLNLFMIAHIIQWRIMGKTVSPIEPSETMYTLQKGFVNAGFIFFTLAILATLIFGRFVCGWGCHILALQDLCGWLLKKMGLHPKPFRSRLLVYVPLIAALYMFVWPVVYRLFTATAGTTDPEIHQSSGDHKFLADVSFRRGGDPVSVHMRFHDSLFFGAERLLHLCLSVRRFLRARRQILAGKNPRDARVQSVRTLHCHLHFQCPGACGSEAVRDGGRSGLHEMHGLRQRLPERRALFRFRKTDAVGAQIYRDQEELLADLARRNRRRTGFPGEFPGCARCLRVGSIPDGARLRCSHDVPHSEIVAIASARGNCPFTVSI